MRRTYRYPLHPTKAQAAVLESWLAYCCDLYNAALEHRIGAWRRGRFVSYYTQTAELTTLRDEDAEAGSMPRSVQTSALRRLDRAFASFFRRCKAGEKPGFPRFRGRRRCGSFSFGDSPRVIGNRVFIPRLGAVRFHLYRPLLGEAREATVQQKCGRWSVCFSCELGAAPERVSVQSAVGIDLGITSFAVLSDGTEIGNPRYFRAGEELLAGRQRALARKRGGSRGCERAKLLVAKAHGHIQNQRLDFSRKLAANLFSRYDLVAYEGLAIRNMVRSSLGKSISDAAWGVFIHALTCKAESAGKHAVAVDPRGTSQRCSACGVVVQKDRKERRHECGCGVSLGRDHNAALNVLAAGRAAAGLGPRSLSRDTASPQHLAEDCP